MKDFEFGGEMKDFKYESITTTIPRARFKRSGRPEFSIWLKAEEVRNIVQLSADCFQIFFSNNAPATGSGTPSYNTHYVEVEATPEQINEFWGMKS